MTYFYRVERFDSEEFKKMEEEEERRRFSDSIELACYIFGGKWAKEHGYYSEPIDPYSIMSKELIKLLRTH